MQAFRTDKKLFWRNGLKSWLWLLGVAALLYFVLIQFTSIRNESVNMGIIVLVLLKLADTLTQYFVKEIQIDGRSKQMTILLYSRISGEKIKQYKLEELTSELITNSSITKYLVSPVTLKIHFAPKKSWVITSRNGFSPDILKSVNMLIKSMNSDLLNESEFRHRHLI